MLCLKVTSVVTPQVDRLKAEDYQENHGKINKGDLYETGLTFGLQSSASIPE